MNFRSWSHVWEMSDNDANSCVAGLLPAEWHGKHHNDDCNDQRMNSSIYGFIHLVATLMRESLPARDSPPTTCPLVTNHYMWWDASQVTQPVKIPRCMHDCERDMLEPLSVAKIAKRMANDVLRSSTAWFSGGAHVVLNRIASMASCVVLVM